MDTQTGCRRRRRHWPDPASVQCTNCAATHCNQYIGLCLRRTPCHTYCREILHVAFALPSSDCEWEHRQITGEARPSLVVFSVIARTMQNTAHRLHQSVFQLQIVICVIVYFFCMFAEVRVSLWCLLNHYRNLILRSIWLWQHLFYTVLMLYILKHPVLIQS